MDVGQLRSEICEPFVIGKSAAERSQLDFSGAVELEKKRSHVKVRAGQNEGKPAGLREEVEAEKNTKEEIS